MDEEIAVISKTEDTMMIYDNLTFTGENDKAADDTFKEDFEEKDESSEDQEQEQGESDNDDSNDIICFLRINLRWLTSYLLDLLFI
ncbi:hypothetical protein TVAG_200660 [Trichomonas vaginalis G3]|uniref:Uncharacterized protein n=1 Tax=Trichomonas vaginalis (strain ATCC PRA-98 / G3) TaxID=412133 RepID=A2FS02_TRIV3|nr:hypothetical protein TVAGG3_0737980 [Trichomonas vaginalis G3]EAX92330.1 hypothetical protein TVAG_200660 [Trichomonas vaginalis G3]KAI5511708.1 hypothetical protein TVAGG3_0737980 [Trichomonas vaginalis G3]|eukprot:XP_001305260.1 hypothetical protein [Trichomonas vaginalis G3]